MIAGASARPSIHLQPSSIPLNAPHVNAATNCPPFVDLNMSPWYESYSMTRRDFMNSVCCIRPAASGRGL